MKLREIILLSAGGFVKCKQNPLQAILFWEITLKLVIVNSTVENSSIHRNKKKLHASRLEKSLNVNEPSGGAGAEFIFTHVPATEPICISRSRKSSVEKSWCLLTLVVCQSERKCCFDVLSLPHWKNAIETNRTQIPRNDCDCDVADNWVLLISVQAFTSSDMKHRRKISGSLSQSLSGNGP